LRRDFSAFAFFFRENPRKPFENLMALSNVEGFAAQPSF
jgi:hypothetical protein